VERTKIIHAFYKVTSSHSISLLLILLGAQNKTILHHHQLQLEH